MAASRQDYIFFTFHLICQLLKLIVRGVPAVKCARNNWLPNYMYTFIYYMFIIFMANKFANNSCLHTTYSAEHNKNTNYIQINVSI